MNSSDNKEEYFSQDNQKLFQDLIGTIKQCQQTIADQQKNNGFQKFISQEIFWILHKWLEILFSQNFTHIAQSNEDLIKNLLKDMSGEFQAIFIQLKEFQVHSRISISFKLCNYLFHQDNFSSQLTHYLLIISNQYDRASLYSQQMQPIKFITAGFQKLLRILNEYSSKGIIKLDNSSTKSDLEQYLCLQVYAEGMLKILDNYIQNSMEQYKKQNMPIPFKSDIAYAIIPYNLSATTFEVDDLYIAFEAFCNETKIQQLKKEIHLKKLQFYLDFDNRGQIQTADIDDFFTFVWCNLFERQKFLSEKPFFEDSQKPNKMKLCLCLTKNSRDWDPTIQKIIYIDEFGLWTGRRDREKIRKPVRFGRRAANNIAPCDIYFGPKEKTISKRQFVIKPDINEYYAYCISTTNPTEFLVKNDGAYITKDSVITLSDRVCIIVTECVVNGEEEEKPQIIENDLEMINGPTVKRGKKNNPALSQLQKEAKMMQSIQNVKQFKEQKQTEDIEMGDEETCKEDHRTYEKKNGGMEYLKQFFQKRINNETPDLEEQGQYVTQEFKNQKQQVKMEYDNRLIPNRDMTPNDTKMKNKTYLQLKLDWCELDCEEAIQKAIDNFNVWHKDTHQRHIDVGSARGNQLVIEHPCIKEFQCYFKYIEQENRWIVMDYNKDIMSMALLKDQYTTVTFKPNNEKLHSELFKLQKGTVIVVSGNFLEVDLLDINLDRNLI